MEHEQLWAPWRLAYVKRDDRARKPTPRSQAAPSIDDEACFLCAVDAQQSDRENLVVRRREHSIVVLNRYPYNNGHMLIAPRRHVGRPDELTRDEHLEAQELIVEFIAILERLMNAEGFNVGLNLGRVAGAGLPGHLHWHLVPRWSGDTNFMPVLAGVDIIPQALEALWDMLHEELEKPKASRGEP